MKRFKKVEIRVYGTLILFRRNDCVKIKQIYGEQIIFDREWLLLAMFVFGRNQKEESNMSVGYLRANSNGQRKGPGKRYAREGSQVLRLFV